ncbi:hypothetical protein [Sphingomonas sp.]|uniref:hypothetical protein n=1 Tax=Sphingomonas sp. TaxID=28214 RepID=UPI002D0A6204|nr:hypothetical protein [Sphingomonas sp.]HWK35392.1 hypothetical protein [Sphingomonas sp.]
MTRLQIAWIALTAIAVATSLFGAAAVLREVRGWWRWPLALLALVSVGAFALDWATGEWRFAPLVTLFLAVTVEHRPPNGALVAVIGLPVFAVIALLWRAIAGPRNPD